MFKRKSNLGGRYFEVLEVSDSVKKEEVERAYSEQIRRWNPDKFYRYTPLRMCAEIKTREAHAAYLAANLESGKRESSRFRVVDWKAHFADERRKNLLIERAEHSNLGFFLVCWQQLKKIMKKWYP